MPVYCGTLDAADVKKPRLRVVFGEAVPQDATLEEIRRRIRSLGDDARTTTARIDKALRNNEPMAAALRPLR